MRFLVDESTGAAVAAFLNKEGHDVVAVADSMPQAIDSEILKLAVSENRIVVTNDKDFGDLIFRSGAAHAGVLFLRLKDQSAANRVAVVKNVIEQHANDLADNFVVATESHIRIRKRAP